MRDRVEFDRDEYLKRSALFEALVIEEAPEEKEEFWLLDEMALELAYTR